MVSGKVGSRLVVVSVELDFFPFSLSSCSFLSLYLEIEARLEMYVGVGDGGKEIRKGLVFDCMEPLG